MKRAKWLLEVPVYSWKKTTERSTNFSIRISYLVFYRKLIHLAFLCVLYSELALWIFQVFWKVLLTFWGVSLPFWCIQKDYRQKWLYCSMVLRKKALVLENLGPQFRFWLYNLCFIFWGLIFLQFKLSIKCGWLSSS